MSEDLYSIFNKKAITKEVGLKLEMPGFSFQSFMATIVITTTIKALNIMCFLPSKKEIAGAALYA